MYSSYILDAGVIYFFAACGIPIIYAHRPRDRKREPHNGKISLMHPADYDKEGCE